MSTLMSLIFPNDFSTESNKDKNILQLIPKDAKQEIQKITLDQGVFEQAALIGKIIAQKKTPRIQKENYEIEGEYEREKMF